jgi:hypothetical protein
MHDAVVIGGGVVGCAVALALAHRGADTVLETLGVPVIRCGATLRARDDAERAKVAALAAAHACGADVRLGTRVAAVRRVGGGLAVEGLECRAAVNCVPTRSRVWPATRALRSIRARASTSSSRVRLLGVDAPESPLPEVRIESGEWWR